MDHAPGAPKLMSFNFLEDITNGFSKRLGGGTYGDVYLGELKNGEKIAVKVLKDVLDLDDEEFKKEYHNLASINHKNVVLLVGSCNETTGEYVTYNGREVFAERIRRVLCFEYMCNRSLDKFIYAESNARNWHTRYAIIKGICEGLEYLHEKITPPMYHLDLKPANILLDENMLPKIADFGLSRLMLEERTKETSSPLGTRGYIPPEYIHGGLISVKFDIFSLGVMIIKIMAGRDGYFISGERTSQEFVEDVHTDWLNRLQATSVHPHSIQVRKCIEIALSCVETDRRRRPSIGAIVYNLNKMEILDTLRNGSEFPQKKRNGSESSKDQDHQMCPCICDDNKMLDILKNKLISCPLRITDNRGRVHEAIIPTVGDPAGGTSTFQPDRPRIKIIDCKEGLGDVITIEAHLTEPWILVTHQDCNVSIWNYQNQTRMVEFRNIGNIMYNRSRLSYLRMSTPGIGAAKFIEPVQCFVVGDTDGYIHVCSYVRMQWLQKFRAHTSMVTSLAVHPSEPFVLSAGDKLIKLWNWKIGWQCIQTFEGHLDFVHQVRFSPQTAGNTFASTSNDSTIKIWNIHSPTPVATLDCGSKYNKSLDYLIPSGDRWYLVTGSMYGNAKIWDLQTSTSIKQIEGLQQYGCTIAVVESIPGRPILLTVSRDHTIAFCDSTTHRFENRVKLNLGRVRAFAYINKIRSLAIGCREGIAIIEIN